LIRSIMARRDDRRSASRKFTQHYVCAQKIQRLNRHCLTRSSDAAMQ
jgi:hypothetical protein